MTTFGLCNFHAINIFRLQAPAKQILPTQFFDSAFLPRYIFRLFGLPFLVQIFAVPLRRLADRVFGVTAKLPGLIAVAKHRTRLDFVRMALAAFPTASTADVDRILGMLPFDRIHARDHSLAERAARN